MSSLDALRKALTATLTEAGSFERRFLDHGIDIRDYGERQQVEDIIARITRKLIRASPRSLSLPEKTQAPVDITRRRV